MSAWTSTSSTSTLAELGQPAFRARQVWALGRPRRDGLRRDDRPAARRCASAWPSERAVLDARARATRRASRDGTVKALFRDRRDGRPVEAVLMRYRDGRRSLCLSLAVRLPADLHVLRDRPDEVRAQPDRLRDPRPGAALPPHRAAVDHAVFMGMGEPMMNLDAVLGRLRAAARRSGSRTAARRSRPSAGSRASTASPRATCRSAWRSRCTPPTTRCAREIMPVNDRYPLREVLAACERFYDARRRRVFVEYVMLDGVNDRYEQALRLADGSLDRRRLQGQPDPLQPDRPLRRLGARGDRRVPRRARGARARGDRPAHPRPRHRRRLRPAGRQGGLTPAPRRAAYTRGPATPTLRDGRAASTWEDRAVPDRFQQRRTAARVGLLHRVIGVRRAQAPLRQDVARPARGRPGGRARPRRRPSPRPDLAPDVAERLERRTRAWRPRSRTSRTPCIARRCARSDTSRTSTTASTRPSWPAR